MAKDFSCRGFLVLAKPAKNISAILLLRRGRIDRITIMAYNKFVGLSFNFITMAINDRAMVRNHPEWFGKKEKAPEAPVDTRSPQDKFADACRSVFTPVPAGMAYKPTIKEKIYGNQVRSAKKAIGEMAVAGLSREEFIQMLLVYPLELRWDILEYNLLPAWNEAVPQTPVSIEELKQAKGVVEDLRAETKGRVLHRGGPK